MNKTLVILVVLAIIVILGVVYFNSPESPIINNTTEGETTALGTYFQNRLIALGVADIGQPIEGFDADLLIMAFPGLTVNDFNGVQTIEGHYELINGQLTLVRSEGAPITSAERMVSEAGYNTLLENVTLRLARTVSTNAEVDQLIELLDTN